MDLNPDRNALAASIASSKYSKTWITNKLNQLQDHELKMELLRTYQADPDLFWKLILVGGASAAFIGGLVSTLGGEAEGGTAESTVLPKGVNLGGTMLFVGGLTLTAFAALMLLVPRLFGPDGIQIEASGGGFGLSGEVSIG